MQETRAAARAATRGDQTGWTSLPRLVALEWFKLAKRPMPYILAVVLAAFLMTNSLLAYIIVRLLPSDDATLNEAARRSLLASLALPDAVPGIFANVQNLASVMVIILTAVALGGEFGWGTVRLLLGRGVGRAQFIIAKVLTLAGWSALFVVSGVVAGLVGAVLITVLERSGLRDALSRSALDELPLMFARTYYALLIYLLLTVFITVATRSTAAGMATALVYYFVEGLVGNILTLLMRGGFGRLLHVLIGVNVQGLMSANGRRLDAPASGFNVPPPGQAALVLALYGVTFLVGALLIFRRRDVTGGGGQ